MWSLESRNSVYSNNLQPETHWRQRIQYTSLSFDFKIIGGKEFSILYYHLTWNSLKARNLVYSIIIWLPIIWPETHCRQGIQYITLSFDPKLIRGKEFSNFIIFFTQNSLEARNSAESFSKLHHFFDPKHIGGKVFSVLFFHTMLAKNCSNINHYCHLSLEL